MEDFTPDTDYSNKNLILGIHAWGVSIISSLVAEATKSNIAWLIGILAGAFSIYASYMAIKERRLNIKIKKKELDEKSK